MLQDPLYNPEYRDGHNPLSPALYDAIKRVLGRIKIANEGEPFAGNSYFDPSLGRQRLAIRSSGEYYRANCPYCQDQRHRLWINHMFGQVDAVTHRRINYLVTCYNENCLSVRENRLDLENRLFGFRNRREREQLVLPLAVPLDDPSLNVCDAPGNIIPIRNLASSHKAWQYMVGQRRYSPEMLDAYEIGYVATAAPKYREAQDRIYFPVRMRGELVHWQCRYIGDGNWRETGIAKYWGLPGGRKRFILYNYDRARLCPFVVVVEGVTDVHRLGDHSVALFGKTVSRHQQDLLIQTWPDKPIVFLFDPDASESMQMVVEELARQRRGPVLSIGLPGDLDPSDHDAASLWAFIRNQAHASGVLLW